VSTTSKHAAVARVCESVLHEYEFHGAIALRSALDRKYTQLGEAPRAVLRRVAIFPGEFTLEAASEVAIHGELRKAEIPGSVVELEANSLVESRGEAGSIRYRLPLKTRAFALTKLASNSELDSAARSHAEYLQHLFEDAEVQLDRQVATHWIANYGRLIDDVRAALDWAFSPTGDPSIGVGLTVAAIPLWILSSRPDELCCRIERALESKAAATHSAREMQLRAAARLAGMTVPAKTRLM
jgi:predicted ATPase